MYMGVLPSLCLCTTFMLGVLRGQKRVLDSLELDLQMAVSHHVGAWN